MEYLDRRHPNVFIISAPKTGTTSLYELLMGHSLCKNKSKHFMYKEPHYYLGGDSFRLGNPEPNYEEYLNLYEPRNGTEFSIDASTNYITSHVNYRRILENGGPNVKIIMILRNPVDRFLSGYIHFRAMYKAITDKTIFDSLEHNKEKPGLHKYITELQSPYHDYNGLTMNMSELIQMRKVNYGLTAPLRFDEFYKGEYYSHIRELQTVFGRDNLHIIDFEDLTGDSVTTVMVKLYNFLNVNYEDIALPYMNTKDQWLNIYDSMPDITHTHIMDLREYYLPHNNILFRHLGVEYDWNTSSRWYRDFGINYVKSV